EFVHHLFLENVFKETPRFRGVYFTSGTQEGRPIDRVMSAMAEAFGQPQVQLPAPQVESKSYFLRDMFLGIVFRDGDAAMLSPDQLRRRRRRTYLTAGVIFALAMGISGLPALAWAMNRSYLDETEEVISDANEAASATTEGPAPEAELSALFDRARQLDEYDDDGPPMHMQLGMYQDDVFPHVRDLYLHQFHDRVIGPMLAADTQSMLAFGQRVQALNAPPDAEEMKVMYDHLKLHLLLTEHGALAEGLEEPPLDDELDDFLVEQLHHAWAEATGTERHQVAYRSMREQLRYYVEALHDSELASGLRFERSDPAVGAVRAVFAAVGSYTVAVQGIISEIEPLNYDVRLGSMVGQVQSIQARAYVRGAFTKRAWDDRVEDMLDEDAARFFGENWVLGNPPPESDRAAERERDEQLARLRATYFQMYVLEWERFLASMTTPALSGPQDQMIMLREYMNGEPPMVERLIRMLDTNVSLVPPGQGANSPSEVARRARDIARRRGGTAIGRVTRIGGANARILMDEGDRRAQAALADQNNGPQSMTPAMVREAFLPLVDFAPAPQRNAAPGSSEMVRPVTRYQEQLAYMRDSLQQEQLGSNLASFEERQASAQTLTLAQIEEQPLRWRNWFRAILLPPVQGTAFERPSEPILHPSVDMSTLAAQSNARGAGVPVAVPGVLPGQPPVPTPTDAPAVPAPGAPTPVAPPPAAPAAPAPAAPAPAAPAAAPTEAPAEPAPRRRRGGNEWWR
ncbi:MAG: ImcF-related family protein, partial [Sandaracinaceae bacterium]